MPAYFERRFDRNLRVVANSPADVLVTALVVDIRCDPSQQIQIYGFTFGFETLLNADKGLLQFAPFVGHLNISADNITGTVVPPLVGTDRVVYESITDGNLLLKTIDYANPLIINGDMSVTFVLYPPFTSAALGSTWTHVLTVRGEVTQIPPEDRARIGNWRLR